MLLLYRTERDGDVAFNAPPAGWMQTALVRLAGGRPVWTESALGKGWTKVGFEQIAAWNADRILMVAYSDDVESVRARLSADPQWRGLRAVKQGRLASFPGDLHSWDQPTTRWILGLLWLAEEPRPERLRGLDIRAEARGSTARCTGWTMRPSSGTSRRGCPENSAEPASPLALAPGGVRRRLRVLALPRTLPVAALAVSGAARRGRHGASARRQSAAAAARRRRQPRHDDGSGRHGAADALREPARRARLPGGLAGRGVRRGARDHRHGQRRVAGPARGGRASPSSASPSRTASRAASGTGAGSCASSSPGSPSRRSSRRAWAS